MDQQYGFDDISLEYVSIAAAREMNGLRLVLGAYAIPGPWREACKGLFDVKGIPYTAVRASNVGASEVDFGRAGTHSELIAWTAQSSAPVAVWNNERPRSAWLDQLNLAERLSAQPRLIPTDIGERSQMFGLINELAGENGLGWNRRWYLVHRALTSLAPDNEEYAFWRVLGDKYLYTPAAGAGAVARMVEIITTLDRQLAGQTAAGRDYLLGTQFSALDIYWATFCAVLQPLPAPLCPMASSYRPAYTNDNSAVARALTPALLRHRDRVYHDHLPLPVVF